MSYKKLELSILTQEYVIDVDFKAPYGSVLSIRGLSDVDLRLAISKSGGVITDDPSSSQINVETESLSSIETYCDGSAFRAESGLSFEFTNMAGLADHILIMFSTYYMMLDDIKLDCSTLKVGNKMRFWTHLNNIFFHFMGQPIISFCLDLYQGQKPDIFIRMIRTLLFDVIGYAELKQFLKSPASHFKAEGLDYVGTLDALNNAASDWLGILSSEFGSKLTTLCSLLICSPIINKLGIKPELFGYDEALEKALRLDMKKYSTLSIGATILEHTTAILLKLSHTFVSIKKYGPVVGIRSLFVSRDDFLQLESEYTWLKTNVRNFGCCSEVRNPKNLAEKQPFTLEGYYQRCELALDLVEKVMPILKKDPAGKHRFERMKFEILGFQSDCAAELRVNDSRPCPYAVMLCGPPSVGKSMIKDIVLTQLHATDNNNNRFDVPYSPSNVYTYNPTDDFFSGFRTSHTSILLDDIAQKKPDLIKTLGGDDLMHLIRIINTVAFTPNQAELEKKGKTPMRVRYVVGTTNTPDLSAYHVFNCVSAVYRRMIFIHVEVKKQFREESSCALRGDDSNPDNLDLWEFKVEQCRPCGNGVTRFYWNGEEWKSSECVIDVEGLVKFLNIDLERHWKKQDKADHAFESLVTQGFCHHGISKLICSTCKQAVVPFKAEGYQQQGFFRRTFGYCCIAPALTFYGLTGVYYYFRPPSLFTKPCWSLRVARWFTGLLPDDNVVRDMRWLSWAPPRAFPYLFKSALYTWYDQSMEYGQDLYEYYTHNILEFWKYPAFAAALILFYKMYRSYHRVGFKAEASDVMPVPSLDDKNRRNYWLREMKLGVFPAVGSTISVESLEAYCGLNNVYLRVYFDDSKFCFFNAFALCSNLLVGPFHCWREAKPIKAELWRLTKSGDYVHLSFPVDETNIYSLPERDLIFMRFDRMDPFKDLMRYFARASEPIHINGYGKYIYKALDGEGCFTDTIEVKRVSVDNAQVPYITPRVGPIAGHILHCVCERPTFDGLCGAPLMVSQGNQKMIAGIHIAGDKRGTTKVRQVFIDDIELALRELKIRNISDNVVDIADNFNAEAMTIVPIAPQCPTHKLRTGELVVIGGNSLPRTTLKTNVRNSPFADDVLNHYRQFGFTKITHTSPKECSPRAAIELSMTKAVENASFLPSDISFVVEAMSAEFLDKMSSERLKRLKPCPWSVAVNGRDGIPYMERLPLKTSGGYGHPGPKKQHFVLVGPTEAHEVCYEMTDQLRSEVEWIEKQYSLGLEANPVFKATFKDEPITFEKAAISKVRIFTASPVAFSLVVRKYLLCIVREFSGKDRLDFEMAIGANAHGRDWHDITQHIVRHGENRCFAGDYKNFDKQMPPELILAAFDVIRNIFKAAGWEAKELQVLDGIAHDIAFPTTDLFGTLVQFYGANPSGHPLTAHINSLVNSLYMRLACLSIFRKHGWKCVLDGPHKHRLVNFRKFSDIMSLVTYGDDNCGTTSSSYPFINHGSIQKALGDAGIIYTTDDKEAESKGFCHLANITFLKRRFVFDNTLKRYIGPLAEESIFKMLTVFTYSKTICKEEQMCGVIQSANREYFFYGKERFQIAHNFFQELLDKYDCRNWLPEEGLLGYDQILVSVEEKVPGALEITVQEDVATPTSG